MTEAYRAQIDPTRSPRDVPAKRTCLRCKVVFQSEGFGERICPRCKGSALWKSAVPAPGNQR